MTIGRSCRDYWNAPAGPREVLGLALPLFLSTCSLTIQVFIDRLFLTWYSQEANAASIPAVCVLWVLVGPLNGIVTFANTFVAQYHGACRHERVGPAVGQAVLISIVGGLGMLALAPAARLLFAFVGHDAKVVELEAVYLQTLLPSAAPMLVMNSAACFFGGLGRTWIVLGLNVLAMVVNLVLDYALIFGQWGLPEWGIAGAGVATAAGYFVAAAASIVLLWVADTDGGFGIRPAAGRPGFLAPDGELLRRLLWYGGPNGLMMLVDVMAFTWFVLLVGRLGTESLAATNTAFNINMLAFGPMIGMGTATQILVGQRLGEDRADLATRATWSAFSLSLVYTVILGALYVLAPELCTAPIRWNASAENSPAVFEQVVVLLRFVAVYAIFDMSAMIFSSALRGAGDTRFVMIVTLAMAVALLVVPSLVAIEILGGNVTTAWFFVTGYIVALGATFFVRFQNGVWRSMRVIESAVTKPASELLENIPVRQESEHDIPRCEQVL